ncbi:MAG: methyltransferase domain-containing protein [candidate division NC10 bacterium]|nr:methyltransferase domain-containing protein [candidate division NC10 bacterium]
MALDVQVLRSEIQKVYADVAHDPKKGYHFHTGREYAEKMLGYSTEWLDAVPAEVVASFAGVGCPLSLGPVHVGETVLDIGCGAGMDSFIAAHLVGPVGRVIGLDMTESMLAKALRWREECAIPHLDFRRGLAEEIPLPDGSVDVVISNGVINLTPDKGNVFREIHRVLRPGGRLQIADIIVHKDIPPEARDQVDIWTA